MNQKVPSAHSDSLSPEASPFLLLPVAGCIDRIRLNMRKGRACSENRMNVDIGFMRDIEKWRLFFERKRMQLSVFCVLEGSRRERMLKHSSPLLLIKPTSTENSACDNGGDELKISE